MTSTPDVLVRHGSPRNTPSRIPHDGVASAGLRPGDERQGLRLATVTVTVVFTDLVGSTALLSRVGPTVGERLRVEHFALLREAVAGHGGREVKNTGDGLMVVFDGPAAAMSCAVAMQQALAARPPDAEPLRIRVGVSVGEVDVDDGDYFGLPVVEAARLCAHADADEVLVSDLVRLLARSRSPFPLEALGALELKGLAEPVEAHRVVWEPLPRAGAVVPVPARMAAARSSVFVGRTSERDVLEAAFKDASGGRCRGVLISGEPGIGKTTLASTFAVSVTEQDAWVLYGRCDEDLFVPYQPWVEALGHLVEHAPEAVLADHVRERGGVLTVLVPRLARRLAIEPGAVGTGDEERHLLFTAVVDLLTRASEHTPLVLLLDDLHWADQPSTQLLRHVLTTATTARLLVMGTFRDSDVGRASPLSEVLAALHREQGIDRLRLRGLGDHELLALLETLAGHEMGAEGVALRDALLAEADGNPFFTTELLRHLVDTGSVARDAEGRWSAPADLPATGLPVSIREVIGARIARLGGEVERLLTLAAVIGRDFDVELLARVGEVSEDRVVELCESAVDATVLRETDVADRYTFSHALVERTLYDALSATRRARAHRAVAEALEDTCGDDPGERIGELAFHWAQASRPQDTGKAFTYACRAGERALGQLAPAEALRWFGQAVDLAAGADIAIRDVIAARIGLGTAQRLIGDTAHRTTLLEAARDARSDGHGDLLVAAALANSRGLASAIGAIDVERIDTVRAAIDAVGGHDSAERARLLAVLAAETTYDPDPATSTQAAAEAVAIARRLDDPRTFVEVVATCKDVRSTVHTVEEHAADTAEACRHAETTRDASFVLLAHWAAGIAASDLGDRDRLDVHLVTVREAAVRTGLALHRMHAAHLGGLRTNLDGDPAEIETMANAFLQAAIDAGYEADGFVHWNSMVVLPACMRGELGPLLPFIEQSMEADVTFPVYRSVLAWACANVGELHRARTLLAEGRARGFDEPEDYLWLLANGAWAETAYRTGEPENVDVLCARLEPRRRLMTSSHASLNMISSHYAGLARAVLGDLDLAVSHLDEALDRHRQLRAPFHVACTEVALAEVLASRGTDEDLDRARRLAADAAATATERGYGYVQRDAAAVIAAVS